MRIMMVAAEATPYVKVGGLADVVGALSGLFAELGSDVELVLPGYRRIVAGGGGFDEVSTLGFYYAGRSVEVEIRTLRREDGVTVTLVADPLAFDRPGIYDDPDTKEGYPDNAARFAFFSRAAAELLVRDPPDLVHVHDSHAALIPGLLKVVLGGRLPRAVPSVLTIHNLAYQTLGPPGVLFDAGFPPALFHPMSPLEFYGSANFLKAGIAYADAITTVSRRYAEEIQTAELGCGLEGVLSGRRDRLFGILNGIDTDAWDPATDPHLEARYSAGALEGKWRCREALLLDYGLAVGDAPLFGMVGRLADQKGLDIFAAAAERLAERSLRFAILGSGQQRYHEMLAALEHRFPERFRARFGFDDGLAHRIEAGADFFLMPSRFEPCGLNQMFSLRYGTIPVVRRTGGLADTVVDYDEAPDRGTGFSFDEYSPEALIAKVDAACRLYAAREERLAVVRRGMSADFSARRSAREYLDLFQRMMR